MDYQNGKIYKITNCIDDEVYIGSTCTTLSKRWYEHKRKINSKPYKIYQHINDLGFDKFSISLVENYPCTNKSELLRREGELIREHGTLNSKIEGRTRDEWNKDKNYNKPEYDKTYRNIHKEKLVEKAKEYYQKNKDRFLKKIECDICKSIVNKGYLTSHQKSKKCLAVSEESKTEHNELQANELQA